MRFADRHARVAARLRDRGFTVVEQSGWRDRGANGRDMSAVQGLTVHHTATGGTLDLPTLHLLTNGRADLTGPLSQWSAGRAGTLALVAAGLAYHAGATWEPWQDNYNSVGIECENNGVGEPWGPLLVGAMQAWAQEMRREFGIPQSRVMGHREVCRPAGRKIDPANFDMNAFRRSTDPVTLEENFLSALTPAEQREVLDRLRNLDGIVTRSGLGSQLVSLVDGKTKGYLDNYALWADGKLDTIIKLISGGSK